MEIRTPGRPRCVTSTARRLNSWVLSEDRLKRNGRRYCDVCANVELRLSSINGSRMAGSESKREVHEPGRNRMRPVAYWGEIKGRVQTEWFDDEPRLMTVLSRVVFQDRWGWIWTAVPGAVTDGASVPWLLRRIIPIYVGFYRRAVVLHDVACVLKYEPSWRVHRMFYEAMRCDADLMASRIPLWRRKLTSPRMIVIASYIPMWGREFVHGWRIVKAWLMWKAVRIFGPRFPGKTEGQEHARAEK